MPKLKVKSNMLKKVHAELLSKFAHSEESEKKRIKKKPDIEINAISESSTSIKSIYNFGPWTAIAAAIKNIEHEKELVKIRNEEFRDKKHDTKENDLSKKHKQQFYHIFHCLVDHN